LAQGRLRGRIIGINIYDPAPTGIVWLKDVIPAPLLNFQTSNGGSESQLTIAPLNVLVEKLIDRFAATALEKRPHQKLAKIWDNSRRNAGRRNFDRTPVFQRA